MLKVFKDGMLLAFQFLTIIPIRKQIAWDEKRAKAMVALYPLTGVVLGAFLSVLYGIFFHHSSVTPLVLTMLILSASILYSGGLHLDGWMDMSDAFLSRRDREKKLAILKDSHVGAFGVLSLLFLLGWRFAFLYELMIQIGSAMVPLLCIMPILTRFLIGIQLSFGAPASESGMAAALTPYITKGVKRAYGVWFFTLATVMLYFLPFVHTAVILMFILLFPVVWVQICKRQIGGINGDTIGAGIEGGETLLWGVLWLLLCFGMA
ncbi:adenosylcobinamide-GDP ribazoletransferase [Halalkalibacterium ligniniphilum]|uniref:adenosylcobinamide-GDP ribazoletransferase n=1 Tax=Halalkalibacterium ligniniphilum TaxID=1134413 RepID=UPI000346735D|nr:adenosylcobinamide-GDP ribazoletransferase [Halalkalibacterium ligniniphilum]